MAPQNVPQYVFVMISEEPEEAKKVFVNRLKDDINNYIYSYHKELINAWDEITDIPGFADPNMSLAEVIIRPDAFVINTNIKIQNRDVACVSCGFVNTYGTSDLDDKTYKCFKCKSGW